MVGLGILCQKWVSFAAWYKKHHLRACYICKLMGSVLDLLNPGILGGAQQSLLR